MPSPSRPKPGLVNGTAKRKVPKTAASALRAKNCVVRFDDFQSTFFPARPEDGQRKAPPDASDRASP